MEQPALFLTTLHQIEGRCFTLDEAIKAAPIVANAGLYNGFLAGGLIWGLVFGKTGYPFKVFLSNKRHDCWNLWCCNIEMDYTTHSNYPRCDRAARTPSELVQSSSMTAASGYKIEMATQPAYLCLRPHKLSGPHLQLWCEHKPSRRSRHRLWSGW